MPAAPLATPQPFFLPTAQGRLFAVHHRPSGGAAPSGNILVVPAFNEEMNRCRSIVTAQAQIFAAQGVGTLVLDLYGTGESDGEHGDARWSIWQDNVRVGIDWLDAQPGGCAGLLGIRLGVPLALSVVGNETRQRALIAWQPVVDGKTYFTQFLRTRIAANMDRTDIPKETTATMRAQLAAGASVEVAGYQIHPELAAAIDALRLAELTPPPSLAIAWCEKGSAGDGAISPASDKLLAAWRAAGRDSALMVFDDPAFWALHDRCAAPALLRMTSDWLRTGHGQ